MTRFLLVRFHGESEVILKGNHPKDMWEKIKRKSACTDITVPRHDGKTKKQLQNICTVRQNLCI